MKLAVGIVATVAMFRVNLVGGGFLAIIMMVYHVGVMAEVYRDISIDRFKSRYLKVSSPN